MSGISGALRVLAGFALRPVTGRDRVLTASWMAAGITRTQGKVDLRPAADLHLDRCGMCGAQDCATFALTFHRPRRKRVTVGFGHLPKDRKPSVDVLGNRWIGLT